MAYCQLMKHQHNNTSKQSIQKSNLKPLTRIVAECHVSRLRLGNQRAIGIKNVFHCRRRMDSIVHEDRNVLVLKSMDVLNILHHVFGVDVAAR